MVSPPVNLDRRGCDIDIPTVLLDGAQRDRCPYIGDQAVTGMTLLVSQDDVRVLRDMLAWFASDQNADGSIPASPFRDHSLVLVDYNAYWIESLYDYVLYTGDLALLRQVWPNLVKLVDELYPAHVGNGLLVNWLGAADYAYIPRGGARVAYYNAQYVRALRPGRVARGWYGDGAAGRPLDGARRRHGRARSAARSGTPGAGAFRDTTGDTDVHALDGNAFAILAGLATPAQAQSVLAYIDRTMRRSYGNSVADTNGWRGSNWSDGDFQRVYPFISYFEVLARYAAGADASALELIKREWGFMARAQPGDDVGDDRRRVRRPGRRHAVVGPRLVERRRPGAHELRARRAADLARASRRSRVTPHPSGLMSARGRCRRRAGRCASRGRSSRQARAPGHGAAGHGLGQPGAAADGRSERRRRRTTTPAPARDDGASRWRRSS